jgi:hypothetical protein
VSPGIDSKELKELIPPVYVAWRAGTSNRVRTGPQGWELIPRLLKRVYKLELWSQSSLQCTVGWPCRRYLLGTPLFRLCLWIKYPLAARSVYRALNTGSLGCLLDTGDVSRMSNCLKNTAGWQEKKEGQLWTSRCLSDTGGVFRMSTCL